MGDAHRFSVEIQPDPLNPSRYRWTICEGFQIVLRSPGAYKTFEEAAIEATQARRAREAARAHLNSTK
jgi:hypothetical protein